MSLADGSRLAVAATGVVVDPSQNNGVVTNGASCHSCHNAGMISSVISHQCVIDNKFQFDTDTYQQVMNTFPDQQTMQTYIDRDSAVHVNALVEAGVPKGTTNPVSRLYIDFQLANISTAQVAGELQVTKDELVQNLQLLDPTLRDLRPDLRQGLHRASGAAECVPRQRVRLALGENMNARSVAHKIRIRSVAALKQKTPGGAFGRRRALHLRPTVETPSVVYWAAPDEYFWCIAALQKDSRR